MNLRFPGRSADADESSRQLARDVDWLPRARLRSGGRGDRLLWALTVTTACVLAAAAGLAVWGRHGDLVDLRMFSASKAPERAPTDRPPASAAPAAPAQTVRTVTPSATPPQSSTSQEAVRRIETSPAPVRPQPVEEPPPREVTTIRTTPSGVPIDATTQREPVAEALPPIPLPSAPPPAPQRSASAGSVEISPPPPPVRNPEPFRPQDLPGFNQAPGFDGSLDSPPPPAREVARSAPPERAAPSPASSPSPSPATGGRVAVYLDEYPDQKAAAAALPQKSGAYGKIIGSAGKLTYTRRNGDWRLRVSNLDRATAEALCAKLRGAGAPCSVGPN